MHSSSLSVSKTHRGFQHLLALTLLRLGLLLLVDAPMLPGTWQENQAVRNNRCYIHHVLHSWDLELNVNRQHKRRHVFGLAPLLRRSETKVVLRKIILNRSLMLSSPGHLMKTWCSSAIACCLQFVHKRPSFGIPLNLARLYSVLAVLVRHRMKVLAVRFPPSTCRCASISRA